MTLKRLAAKITPKNAHLITLSDAVLSVKPKANVSSQLNFRLFVSCQLKFWPFVSCQLTPPRPSNKVFRSSRDETNYSFENFNI